jgi:hypothetical protein
MVVKYQSGEQIKKGDRVLFHREPAQIEFVASDPGDPETDWLMQEYGGGIMILDGIAGHTFIPSDQIDGYEDLEFVSRADMPPEESK